ncbi:Aste57867_21994 [Aphanomyces stellatus]|uniref:Aste57867_21994 protein n=1 Tax=Aphanomyces stellatus TaxID=120398 RepID=A0A485LJ10_9STRA|nr:hypothetical protein As57867_021925 [Aphanomyces stellatus]VFT98662.1 Aste57867_21994 [Aphanomyces stellatus]
MADDCKSMSGAEKPAADAVVVPSPSSASGASTSGATDLPQSGYLCKYNKGKWNSKRKWRQRWFVLENGALAYFKSAPSKKKQKKVAAPRDTFKLGASAVLAFPVDLPRNTPTPFCFSLSIGPHKHLLLCAATQAEFQQWTAVISTTIHPDAPPMVIPDSMRRFPADMPPSDRGSVEADTCKATAHPYAIFHSPSFAVGVCFMLNPFMVLSMDLMLTSVVLIAVYCAWYIWANQESSGSRYARLPPVKATLRAAAVVDEPVAEPLPDGMDIANHPPARVTPPPASNPAHGGMKGYVHGKRAFVGCSLTAMAPAEVTKATKDSFTTLSATRFNVRKGPNYKKNKQKAPSGPALLELVAADVFRSDFKVDNVGSKIQLPAGADGRTDLLILNTQVPCYAPPNPLWGDQKTDGVGFNFVTYFAIPKEIRDQLDAPDDPTHPQIKLMKWFLEEESAVRDRLKAIVIVANPAEQKLGRMEKHLLETYNGQPILTRPEHRFYRGDGYFEVDIDAHIFNYLARKGLTGITEHFGNMVVDFGFVFEGHDDDELPEQIFGCGQLCKVDVNTAPHISFR